MELPRAWQENGGRGQSQEPGKGDTKVLLAGNILGEETGANEWRDGDGTELLQGTLASAPILSVFRDLN